MSRTYVHTPIKVGLERGSGQWQRGLIKHCNTRCRTLKRWASRVVRHSAIDEEENKLTDSLADTKRMSYIIRNKYW